MGLPRGQDLTFKLGVLTIAGSPVMLVIQSYATQDLQTIVLWTSLLGFAIYLALFAFVLAAFRLIYISAPDLAKWFIGNLLLALIALLVSPEKPAEHVNVLMLIAVGASCSYYHLCAFRKKITETDD